MRILADEDVAGIVVQVLRKAGHDVAWISEIAAGIADEEVLARAVRDGRLVLTFDKGFGEPWE